MKNLIGSDMPTIRPRVSDHHSVDMPSLFSVNRFHVYVMATWIFVLFYMGQLIFPVFSNYLSPWKCGDGPVGKDCAEYDRCNGNVTFIDPQFQSAAIEFGWICGGQAYYRAAFSQVQFVGVLIGTVLFGSLSDALGRKPISVLTLGVGISMNFLSGLAPSWQLLLLMRFVVGLTIGGSSVVVITYSMEMLLPSQRMILRTIFNWGITRTILTLICMAFPEWRAASIVCALTTLPALLIVIFIFPESPTWLHNKDRLDEMVESEKHIARIAREEYRPVEHKKIEHVKTFCELIHTGGLFKRLLILWTMWFTACMCSYATDFNSTSLSGDLFFNQILYGILIAISKLVLLFVDTKFPDFLTRRVLHQGSQSVVIACFLILTVLTVTGYQGVFFLVCNLIGTVFIEYTWDCCYLCAIESMETSCRSSATGSCSLVARIGALIAPVLNHLNTQWPPAVYFTVVAMGSLNLLVSYLFLVETKTVNLDEVTISDEPTEETPMLEKGKAV